MAYIPKKRAKSGKKDFINATTRKKLGVTQEQLALMFNVHRSTVSNAESKRRTLDSASHVLLLNFYLQFHELETGKQASYRSLETRSFLNAEYKKILPKMKAMELDCRNRLKQLNNELTKMKERARDAEHAIIVLTTTIKKIEEDVAPGDKKQQLEKLNFFKEQAYRKLLTCWEPEQAKLHSKIEAVAGEAKALRRYRVKITKDHNPMKNRRY